MWNTKLCLGTSPDWGMNVEEQILLFKQVGFDGFFTGFECSEDIDKYSKIAKKEEITYQSVHAPFGTVNKMWIDEKEARETTEILKECINSCHKNQIPIMVCHTFIGFDEHNPTSVGIKNFEKVVLEAEKCDVKIAFENTEGEEYLHTLMHHFEGCNAVGFCWDTGHEMCYNHSKDMLALYGDRLLCTHLNDNLGIRDYEGKITYLDDLHLLPFDGIADWKDIADRLNKYNYNDFLTFELNRASKPGRRENIIYEKMDLADYVTEVYKRACRVAALKNNYAKHGGL